MSAEVLRWAAGRDTGLSSMAIWTHMLTGAPPIGYRSESFADFPHDSDDFGRCYRLLLLEPAWAARIGEMAQYNPEWAALSARWSELTVMYEKAHNARGDWHKWAPLCDRIRQLTTTARTCADCGKQELASFCRTQDGVIRCLECAPARRGVA